ncbi:MAG: hypothetical protein V3V57_08585, partial [Spirochaetia bacterium]
MARRRASVDLVTILQIVVAVFLVTLGLIAIIHYNADLARFGRGMNKLFGRANDPLNLVVAIVEVVAGVIVFAGVFFAVQSRLLYGATLVIAVLWIIQIILSFFASNFAEPDLIVWLNRLAADLIV